jgi:hypothetical protein
MAKTPLKLVAPTSVNGTVKPPRRRPNAELRSLAREKGGAVAFRWRDDVEFGRPGSIEIIAGFGELPTEVQMKGRIREA